MQMVTHTNVFGLHVQFLSETVVKLDFKKDQIYIKSF